MFKLILRYNIQKGCNFYRSQIVLTAIAQENFEKTRIQYNCKTA